jgi:site-specific DNA-cytosine methylase
MSKEDSIIGSVIFERNRYTRTADNGSNEARQINKYGRKMIRLSEAGRIKSSDSDQQIVAAITPIMAWLFWQIAPELLLWIVKAIRKRIWDTQQGLAGE